MNLKHTLLKQLVVGWRFLSVGVLGIGVNQAALAAMVELGHFHYLFGAIVATVVSSTFNFGCSELWVFRGRGSTGGIAVVRRYVGFLAVNSSTLLIRLPMLYVLTSLIALHYLVANLLAIGAMTGIRFLVADMLIWPGRPVPQEVEA
ncbi:MAG TPA: GtrA family protein [Candidatus Dormibacteraeota bacterium]|jgi:putative flippase GtrA